MGTPYENPPLVSDAINGGGSGVVTLDYPSRSVISAIKVIQASGVAVVFDVELLNRDPTSLDGYPEKNFYVCSKKTAGAAGILLYFADEGNGGHGYTFFNQDAQESSRIKCNIRRLYVRITPQGSGVKTFAITITSEVMVGGE